MAQQVIDILGGGGERGDKTHDVGAPAIMVEDEPGLQQRINHRRVQPTEQDIRLGAAQHFNAAQAGKPLRQALGGIVGLAGIAQPEIIAQVRIDRAERKRILEKR